MRWTFVVAVFGIASCSCSRDGTTAGTDAEQPPSYTAEATAAMVTLNNACPNLNAAPALQKAGIGGSPTAGMEITYVVQSLTEQATLLKLKQGDNCVFTVGPGPAGQVVASPARCMSFCK
ncbi:hypothetical protein GCM10007067_12570 [Lysobacter bugurensis]|uniref:Lipoprotein n=1 Tax=Cognatilysobacter bugurensis TaxID=543356 RepID=A0A918W668_9GAMM|nr:hypothetical protein GCM10007067_12570 [Lysobacter bugurensis]